MTREAAAGLADAPAGQFLGPLTELAPGLRAAALLDPAGAPLAHAPGGLDDDAFADLGTEAARAVAAHPGAALLAIPAIRDAGGNPALVALIQPWSGADGVSGGIAVIALDRTGFAALDRLPALAEGRSLRILTTDGSALFGGDSEGEAGDARLVALPDVPLLLRYRPPVNHAARMLHAALPFVLIALAGLAAALGLAIILGRRDRAQCREIARRAGGPSANCARNWSRRPRWPTAPTRSTRARSPLFRTGYARAAHALERNPRLLRDDPAGNVRAGRQPALSRICRVIHDGRLASAVADQRSVGQRPHRSRQDGDRADPGLRRGGRALALDLVELLPTSAPLS